MEFGKAVTVRVGMQRRQSHLADSTSTSSGERRSNGEVDRCFVALRYGNPFVGKREKQEQKARKQKIQQRKQKNEWVTGETRKTETSEAGRPI